MKKILFLCLLCTSLITSKINAQIDGDATSQTKNLYKNLKKLAFDRRDILFGQEFFNTQSFAINEQNDPNVSDYKSTTGDHPAVLGQDFKWYLTKPWELARMKAAAKYVYNNGGVVTMDFHMDSKYHDGHEFKKYDNVNDTYLMFNLGNQNNNYKEMTWFNDQLQRAVNVLNDLKIPVVVRLFHEMNGNWMWWGTQAYGGSDSYIKMYKYAVDYIKNKTQYALFEWTPNYPFDSGNNPGTKYYPGDNYVDVVGVDFYDIGSSNGQSFNELVSEVTKVSDFAWNHGKIPVLSETGNRNDSPNSKPNWWYDLSQSLQNSNRGYKIAWMLTWVNKPWGSGAKQVPYIAYSNSSSDAKTGLRRFKNQSTIWSLTQARNYKLYAAPTYKMSNENEKLSKIIDETGISIYPNPAKDNIYVNLGSLTGSIISVRITDMNGMQVRNYQNIVGSDNTEISVSGLAKGVYIININGIGINETNKIIIN